MQYVIRERFFYYDDERWRNMILSTEDFRMSFSHAIRKIYDDKSNAYNQMIQLQTEHFLSDTEEYNHRDGESEDWIDEEEFESKFGISLFYHRKDGLKNRFKTTTDKTELYEFLLTNNVHKFELVQLNEGLLTVYFLPTDNEYANYLKSMYMVGWHNEDEKLLIYQGDEELFQSDEIYRYHLIGGGTKTKLTSTTLKSSIFQSVLAQFNDCFRIYTEYNEQILEINWEVATDEAINSMNAVLDPPWFIPKQVTLEDFLQIQSDMNKDVN